MQKELQEATIRKGNDNRFMNKLKEALLRQNLCFPSIQRRRN
jgi:hypothetical protein